MRGDWQLREVSLCLKHGHPLVQLWGEPRVTQRHDTKERLVEIQAAILTGQLNQPREEPSPYDLWLDQRLESGHDLTWLAGQSLYAASTVCRLLGVELLRVDGCDQLDNEDDEASGSEGVKADSSAAPRALRAAQAAGFDVLKRGEEVLCATFDWMAATTASGARAAPQKAFGRLHIQLNTIYRNDPAVDPVRRILRECIFETWAIAAGEDVLGETLPARRLHSLSSAALDTGIDMSLRARLLAEAGVLSDDDARQVIQRTFDAQTHAEILTEVASLVGPRAMSKARGATLGELSSLELDGVLKPWSRDTSVRSPWRVADGLALIADLHERARPVSSTASGWERLQQSRARRRLSLDKLIRAIREGSLILGGLGGDEVTERVRAYHDLVVPRTAIDVLAKRPSVEPEAASIPSVMSATEFGQTVRLWNHGQVPALAASGHVPSVVARHPITRRWQHRMSEEDITAFHSRFVTIVKITRETGLHRNTVLSRLAAKGDVAFTDGERNYGLVYRREEAERAIPELRNSP